MGGDGVDGGWRVRAAGVNTVLLATKDSDSQTAHRKVTGFILPTSPHSSTYPTLPSPSFSNNTSKI